MKPARPLDSDPSRPDLAVQRPVTSLDELRRKLAERTQTRPDRPERLSSGWSALDDALGGGFMRGALNELAALRPGCGLFEVLLPAFLNERSEPGRPPRFWAWVDREAPPYPPALARLAFPLDRWLVVRPRRLDEQFWALEQILRSGLCAGVVSRLGSGSRAGLDPDLRRLQLAAREGDCTAFLLRSARDLQRSSPAPLRLLARPLPGRGRRRRLMIEVLKTRGRFDASPVLLEWSHDALDEPALSRACAGEPDQGPRPGLERAPRALPA